MPTASTSISSSPPCAGLTRPRRSIWCWLTIASPTTATLPAEAAAGERATARRHGVALVEDDVFMAHCRRGRRRRSPPWRRISPRTSPRCRNAPARRLGRRLCRGAWTPAPRCWPTAGLRAISLMASPLTAALATRWSGDGTPGAPTAAIRAGEPASAAPCRDPAAAESYRRASGWQPSLARLAGGRTATAFNAAARDIRPAGGAGRCFRCHGRAAPRGAACRSAAVPDRAGLERALGRAWPAC